MTRTVGYFDCMVCANSRVLSVLPSFTINTSKSYPALRKAERTARVHGTMFSCSLNAGTITDTSGDFVSSSVSLPIQRLQSFDNRSHSRGRSVCNSPMLPLRPRPVSPFELISEASGPERQHTESELPPQLSSRTSIDPLGTQSFLYQRCS